MGADIHLWVERKLPSGKWVMHDRCDAISTEAYGIRDTTDSRPRLDRAYHLAGSRNYRFFAALAAVRGAGPEPRGLPSDVSDYVQHEVDMYGVDGHSHSWMSVREFMPIFDEHCLAGAGAVEVVGGRTTWGQRFERLFCTYLDNIADVDNYRVVFFFDN
jgi:hypothetical protein